MAGSVTIVANILSTAGLLDALDVVFGIGARGRGFSERERVDKRFGRRVRWMKGCILTLGSIQYLCTVLITPIDDRLHMSQKGQYAGYYGESYWYTSLASLHSPSLHTDLTRWRLLNLTRGLAAVIGWVCIRWDRAQTHGGRFQVEIAISRGEGLENGSKGGGGRAKRAVVGVPHTRGVKSEGVVMGSIESSHSDVRKVGALDSVMTLNSG
ncbi:hypothetical protein HK097_003437 [Rhizophlyctis rosea]|uniref:Uncharacterized protein n=1 Tax=Rhizophlyctis rosea TaxID=64517 RepID=A0AAD5S2C7_9FUNG|nr:hypothetical protein HK097_003437 [Rhizophlyctis rosea]